MTTLGSLLVQNRIVGVIEIEKALQRQVIVGGDLATNLLELGLVEENTLTKFAAKSFGMPVLERAFLEAPDESIVKLLPWSAADEHKVVPIKLEGDKMVIAVSSPMPENALAEIGFLLGVDFAPRFVLEFRLAILLKRCFGIPMSKRFLKLKNRLAPEVELDIPPMVLPPNRDTGLMTAADGAQKAAAAPQEDGAGALQENASGSLEATTVSPVSDHPTMPADPDYMVKILKAEKSADASSAAPLSQTTSVESDVGGADSRSSGTPTVVPKSIPPSASKAPGRPSMTPPLDIVPVKEKLLQSTHRDEVMEIFMEAANAVFEYAVLFVIQGTDAVGNLTVDSEGRIRRTSTPVVPLDIGGMFHTAFTTGSFYLGPPGKNTEDELVLKEMNRARPKNCAILPVLLRGRIILMLYGDRGALGVRAERIAELTQLTRLTAEAFERLLLEKKYGKYRETASHLPSRPVHPALSKIPKDIGADLSKSAGQYRIVSTDPSGKIRPTSPGEIVSDPPPLEAPSDRRGDNIESAKTVPMAVSIPAAGGKPPARLALESVPPPSDSDTASATDTGAPTEVEPSGSAGPSGSAIKASKIIALTPDMPRSVVVHMKEEMERLTARILDSTKRFDQAALDVLLGMGDEAAKMLVSHFPGPLLCDRYQETEKLPRVGNHGPLLKAIIAFGKTAIPYILPLMESRDTDIRFYATFLFSEMKFPEALDGLTSRVFDNDRHIRGIAVDVISGFSGYPEYRRCIGQIIDTLSSPSRDLDAKRIAAQALGDLGETSGAEPLIAMLDSVDEKLVRASRRALTKITFFDHGFGKRRWSEWHAVYRNKTRVEWAIEGLINDDDAVRRSAWAFLAPHVEEVVETGPDGPVTLRDYKEIQERLKRWWREEGRDLYRISAGT